VHGTSYSPDQTWSFGLKFNGPGNDFPITGVDKLNSWRDAVRALNSGAVIPTSLARLMGPGFKMSGIRCSALGADGKETEVSTYEFANPIPGLGSASMPGQVALVVSLLTGRPGASYRGRVYLPAGAAQVSVQGRIGTDVAGTIATDFAQWIRDVETAGASILDPQLSAVVYSQVKGVANAITEVKVGTRLDIQRRRADKEKDSYSVAPVPQ
jgi:hypothetical protein